MDDTNLLPDERSLLLANTVPLEVTQERTCRTHLGGWPARQIHVSSYTLILGIFGLAIFYNLSEYHGKVNHVYSKIT